MRDVPASMDRAWVTGAAVGHARGVKRIMVQRARMGTTSTPLGTYRSMIFGSAYVPKEVPSLKNVKWTRSTDVEVATATFVIMNVNPLQVGQAPGPDGDVTRRGFFSANRGKTAYSKQWGHQSNEWAGLLAKNNIIYSFEGHDANWDVGPDLDPNMVPSGMWMIDKIDESSSANTMTITCRDILGKLLADQIATPPTIPTRGMLRGLRYPVSFQARTEHPSQSSVRLSRLALRFDDCSNRYVPGWTNSTPVHGHYPVEAFDQNSAGFWLSEPHATASARSNAVWIQGRVPKATVSEVRAIAWTHGDHPSGGYVGWLSVQTADGHWHGQRVVPYAPAAGVPNNGSAIPYVKRTHTGSDDAELVFKLAHPIENVVRIRVTMNNLVQGAWVEGYRGGIRTLKAFAPRPVKKKSKRFTSMSPVRNGRWLSLDDNYWDYTDIIKWFACISGLHWPRNARYTLSDGSRPLHAPVLDDAYLVNGRAWGDFQMTGTWGPAPLGAENFDKKPILDCMKYIADITNFLIYADESGGLVWTAPNVYQPGNIMPSGLWKGQRRQTYVRITDDGALLDHTVSSSSDNERDQIFVGNVDGKVAAMVRGYVENDVGLNRTAGWTDQNFATQAEAQMMAELIAVRQAMTSRSGTTTIPGYSRIQINDQVEVVDRNTGTGYLHYVRGITSTWDATEDDGAWRYELDLCWVGVSPNTTSKWMFPIESVSHDTKEFLQALQAYTVRAYQS